MTIRQFYDNILSELNKVEAPSLLLEDFVYFANKAVQQYVNKVYNRYDINQQSTDDLRTLKVTSQFEIQCDTDIILPTEDAYWYIDLPEMLHLLNCIVVFERTSSDDKTCRSKKEKSEIKSLARRLTSDMYPNIMNNAYFKPSYKVPYYFITNLNADVTNDILSGNALLENILDPCGESDKNPSVKLEIRCGSNKKYKPTSIFIDYIKVPKKMSLSYTDLESIVDNTDDLEFPEYVCYELVNECVKLIMENASDPRLETNTAINQTIGTNVSQNK